MAVEKLAVLGFQEASGLLPPWLRGQAEALPEERRAVAEEFRLRAGRPPAVVFSEGEIPVPGCQERPVTSEDILTVLEIASQGSVHTVLERLKNGYVSVRGGHRLGLCGSAVVRDGVMSNLRQISSLAIRIARQVPSAASEVLPDLLEEGVIQSTLILSPPGGGKTTLLREIIRCVSDGEGALPRRVGIADERGELAALEAGVPRMDVGARTDVMDGCPKQTGLMMLLRGMNPQVLAMDEITAPSDALALETAAGCGVTLLATAHAAGLRDLEVRPVYRRLGQADIFRRVVVITLEKGKRHYQVFRLGVET